jgi:tetratricopeptide (TPR) repeat protein
MRMHLATFFIWSAQHATWGMRLIEKGAVAERPVRGNAAVRLARLAFDYDPTNVYAWALIRDGLEAEGRLEDAELVGWETIRRFPENPQWRTQLATLLADSLGRPKEAAALLRETVSLFPENAPSRTQLASVLAGSLERPEEAAALLHESIVLFPDDPYPRTQLATVLADDLNRGSDAQTVLETAHRDGVANDITAGLLKKLRRGQKLRTARRGPVVVVPPASEVGSPIELPTAAARRALFRFENGLADVDSIRAFLDQHTPDAYLSYVGERTGVRRSPLKTTFAFAFEAAAREASAPALRALIPRVRPLEGMLVGQAIAAVETRTAMIAVNDNDAGSPERVFQLVRQFSGPQAPAPAARLMLLRDTAASFLSTDVFRIAA